MENLLTQSLKIKKIHFELQIRKMKKWILISNYSHSRFLCWNEILNNSEFYEKNIVMYYYRRPFIGWNLNEECPHVAPRSCNERGIELIYMK